MLFRSHRRLSAPIYNAQSTVQLYLVPELKSKLIMILNPTLLAVILCVPLVVVYLRSKRRRGSYPPGPPGLPLIGNLRDLPSRDEVASLKYHQLCEAYSTSISSDIESFALMTLY